MNLKFVNFRIINYDNINDLTKLEKEQMLKVGKACYNTPGDEFIDTIEDFLDQTSEENCELWQVVTEDEPEKPIYDVWIVEVDTAVVFYTGTTKKTSVGMIQYDFDPIDDVTEEAEKLADALQAAHRNRPSYKERMRLQEIQEKAAREKSKKKNKN